MTKPFPLPLSFVLPGAAAFALVAAVAASFAAGAPPPGRDGPPSPKPPKPIKKGDFDKGRDVFRFETFGTEGFWTDAVRMPQGMA